MARATMAGMNLSRFKWVAQFQRSVKRAEQRLRNVTTFIQDVKAPGSMMFVGEMITNYAKERGPWKDQTTNLRRSLTWVVLAPGESQSVPYLTETEGVQQVPVTNQSNGPTLVVFAGMKYGVYVEVKPGYWVLSRAVDVHRPVLRDLLGAGLRLKDIDRVVGASS